MNLEGVGIGLRFPHFDNILQGQTKSPWFEVITDDFLTDGPHHNKLEKLRNHSPIALHSVGLNIGGVDPIEKSLVRRFKEIYDRFEPEIISDHLCWSAHKGSFHHDLLPIFKSKESLNLVCDRIQSLQDTFKRPLILENITSYIDYKTEEFSEIDFLNEILARTGCALLLDISNVIINHKNRKMDPTAYFDSFPIKSVKQIHLAGGVLEEDTYIDSHSKSVEPEDVSWCLSLIKKESHSIPILIERDANLPTLKELEKERLEVEEFIYEIQ